MKSILIFFILSSALHSTVYSQQAVTTFILTRHAEKGDDGTKDPDLTPAGIQRAQLLAKLLTETKVDAIFSTAYKRTQNTVAPLAKAKELVVKAYEPFKTEELDKMLREYAGGTVVICGHSNNIPSIANYLIGREDYKTFEDADYDNLMIVTVVERGKTTKVTWLNY